MFILGQPNELIPRTSSELLPTSRYCTENPVLDLYNSEIMTMTEFFFLTHYVVFYISYGIISMKL